jgi:hypothetical protein
MNRLPKTFNYKEVADEGAKLMVQKIQTDQSMYTSLSSASQVLRWKIPANTMIHNIPTGNYVTGRMKGKTFAGTAGNIALDKWIYNCFSKFEIKSQSKPVEEFPFMGRVLSSILDLTVSFSAIDSMSIGYLTSETDEGKGKIIVPDVSDPDSASHVHFAVLLPSALIGFLAKKNCPLGYLKSELCLELTLVSNYECLTPSATTVTNLGELEFDELFLNLKGVQLSDNVEDVLQKSYTGNLIFNSLNYAAEMTTIATGQSNFSNVFGFPHTSVKSFSFFF